MNGVTIIILGAVLFVLALAFIEAMPELREMVDYWEMASRRS